MTNYQRQRRYHIWSGAAATLLCMTLFFFLSGLAGHITGH